MAPRATYRRARILPDLDTISHRLPPRSRGKLICQGVGRIDQLSGNYLPLAVGGLIRHENNPNDAALTEVLAAGTPADPNGDDSRRGGNCQHLLPGTISSNEGNDRGQSFGSGNRWPIGEGGGKLGTTITCSQTSRGYNEFNCLACFLFALLLAMPSNRG